MNVFITTSLRRVLPRSIPTSIPSPTITTTKIFIRHESSARRTTKKLRLHPHPSMKLTAESPEVSHIIHNPPSSVPSVYETPMLFLPPDDPRRQLRPQGQSAKPPRPLKKPYEKTYHLTPVEFEEIRKLRREDPKQWTRPKLAEKYGVSSLFIGMIVQATKERLKEVQEMHEVTTSKWGDRRREARAERKKRRDGWGGADGF